MSKTKTSLTFLTFYFTVLRDEFRLMPVDTRVASGDTAILKCIPPRGNPKPRLQWLKNGQPLLSSSSNLISTDSSSSARWHITEVGSLVIEAVQKSDEANYICRAENMVGTRDSDSIRLDVHGTYLLSKYFCRALGEIRGHLLLLSN